MSAGGRCSGGAPGRSVPTQSQHQRRGRKSAAELFLQQNIPPAAGVSSMTKPGSPRRCLLRTRGGGGRAPATCPALPPQSPPPPISKPSTRLSLLHCQCSCFQSPGLRRAARSWDGTYLHGRGGTAAAPAPALEPGDCEQGADKLPFCGHAEPQPCSGLQGRKDGKGPAREDTHPPPSRCPPAG